MLSLLSILRHGAAAGPIGRKMKCADIPTYGIEHVALEERHLDPMLCIATLMLSAMRRFSVPGCTPLIGIKGARDNRQSETLTASTAVAASPTASLTCPWPLLRARDLPAPGLIQKKDDM